MGAQPRLGVTAAGVPSCPRIFITKPWRDARVSYVVLARKWRPMKFEEVVAQQHVTTTLANAIANNRLASAYLFCGPRGVGKTTSARIFAKAINCDQGPTPTPCNQCASCVEITESRSLEVFEIDGASNRGIDEVRNLRENLRYAASKGKYKIYIIDEVHMLTTEAFNALLKTLEEPPPRVLFIFATTEPHKVPATILSRCQRYDFRRIPINDIVRQLRTICDAEKIKIDDEALHLIARKADGSLRDSQSLLDQVISFCGEEIAQSDLTELLGIIDQEYFFECSDLIARHSVADGLHLIEKIFNQGYDFSEFLNGLAEHFRNLLVVKATGKTELLDGLDTYRDRYLEAATAFSETDLLRLIQYATDTAVQIKRSATPKLLLEMAIVKMAKMDQSVELSTLLSNIDNLKHAGSPSPQPTSQGGVQPGAQKARETTSPPAAPVPEPSRPTPVETSDAQSVSAEGGSDENAVVSLETVKTRWQAIVDALKAKKIHLGSFLNEGYPTSLTDGVLEVSFGKGRGFHVNTINQNREVVQQVIFEQTRLKVKVHCRKNESEEFAEMLSHMRSDDVPQEQEQQEVSEEATETLEVPLVKRVLELFDGELVKQAE